MLDRVWRKRYSLTLLVRIQVGAASVGKNMEVPQKTKNRITIWSIPGHIFRQNYNSKWCMYLYIHSSTIHNSQDNGNNLNVDRRRDEDVVYTYMIENHKKEWNNAICSNMDEPEIVILNEVSQKEKDKYHMISFMCGI